MMDENVVLEKIIELTRENERLKIELEKYKQDINLERKRRTEEVGVASEERFRTTEKSKKKES